LRSVSLSALLPTHAYIYTCAYLHKTIQNTTAQRAIHPLLNQPYIHCQKSPVLSVYLHKATTFTVKRALSSLYIYTKLSCPFCISTQSCPLCISSCPLSILCRYTERTTLQSGVRRRQRTGLFCVLSCPLCISTQYTERTGLF